MSRPRSSAREAAEFLAVAFGVSWACGGLAGLGNFDVVVLPDWTVGAANVGFLAGPAVGALFVRRGRPHGAVRSLAHDLRRPVSRGWSGAALALGACGALAVLLLLALTGATRDELGSIGDWAATPLVLLGTSIAALLEEVGWRASLWPSLREQTTPRRAAVVVGAAWGCWHLPLLLTRDGVNSAVPLYAYPTLALGLSPILAWIYEAAGRSAVAPALAHGALNAAMAPIVTATYDHGSLDHLYAVAVPASLVAGGLVLWRMTASSGTCRTPVIHVGREAS